MPREDDESQWGSDPLVRALRAPATPEELTGEAGFVAAYRATLPRGSVRRLVGRFGVGATTAVTTIALSAGVAAAYGRVLPDPVQRIAHSVLGPVGVPAPTETRSQPPVVAPSRSTQASPGKASPPSSSTEPDAAPTPSAPPTTGPAPILATPAGTPTPTDAPTASSTPTSTPTPTAPVRKVPAAVTASVSEAKVVAGSTVTVSGLVTAEDGTPLRGRVVRLLGRSGGVWTKMGAARTDRTGHVTLRTAPLTRNTGLRLSASNHVRSPIAGVVVVPVLSATVTEAAGTSTVTIAVTGAQPGEEIAAYRRTAEGLVKVASARIGTDGKATLTTPTPTRVIRIVLRLPATKQHAKSWTSVVLGRTTTP